MLHLQTCFDVLDRCLKERTTRWLWTGAEWGFSTGRSVRCLSTRPRHPRRPRYLFACLFFYLIINISTLGYKYWNLTDASFLRLKIRKSKKNKHNKHLVVCDQLATNQWRKTKNPHRKAHFMSLYGLSKRYFWDCCWDAGWGIVLPLDRCLTPAVAWPLTSLLIQVTSVSKKEKVKQRPQALNTVEMLRVASSALGMFTLKRETFHQLLERTEWEWIHFKMVSLHVMANWYIVPWDCGCVYLLFQQRCSAFWLWE